MVAPEKEPTWKDLILDIADWVDSLFATTVSLSSDDWKGTPYGQVQHIPRGRIDSENMAKARMKSIDYTWVADAGWRREFLDDDDDEDQYAWVYVTPLEKAEQNHRMLQGKCDWIRRETNSAFKLLTEACLSAEFHGEMFVTLSDVEEARKIMKRVVRTR
jgi:hypothetical protein